MEKKIKIAEERYEEMEARKAKFMKKFAETGNHFHRELADIEEEEMNKLALAIMKAKA